MEAFSIYQNKNKIFLFCRFFIYGLVFITGFFILEKICLADSDKTIEDLIITEIMYDPQGSDSKSSDWIEIYNPTDKKITLLKKSFGIIDEEKLKLSSDKTKYLNCHTISKDIEIDPENFAVIAQNENNFKSIYPKVENVSDSAFSLSSNGDFIRLSNNRCKSFFLEMDYNDSWGGKNNGKTLEKIDFKKGNSKKNWQESFILGGTPGEKSSKKPKPIDYGEKIKINEIYPAPDTKAGEEEFVEIINSGQEEIDFSDWTIKDSKGAKGKISKTKKNSEFFVFYGSFSLNNDSKGDTVFLYDTKDNLVDSQKYSSGKSAYSYSFDSKEWRWTSTATPGKENIFDKILSGKIIMDDKIYKNTYAYFDVKADKDAKKFTWNFGDGHKSYLKNTKHKYEKTGKYSASLKITGVGEDKIYNFTVKVEKYEAPKIRIVRFSANPKGNDTDNEWIEIENKSKKKINLKGWSIATGSEKLVNHPVREDFKIKAGKTKKLTRKICAFVLGNKKTKIEFRSPDGKAVQKIKYDHGKKSIAEDEIYSKVDSKWIWIEPQSIENKSENHLLPLGEGTRRADEGTSVEEEIILPDPNLGKYSTSPTWQKKQKDRLILAYSSATVTLPENFLASQPKVLGTQIIKTQENYYTFTRPINQKHWAVEFFDSIWLKINFSINKLILKI